MKSIIFSLALVFLSTGYSMAKNVDHVGGYRVFVTSGLDSSGLPVDKIDTIKLDHEQFYVYSEWNVPAGKYRYSCVIYDGNRNIVNSQHNTYESDGGNLSFWCSHYLDKSVNKPGDWYAEMGIEGYGTAEIYFNVQEDDIRSVLAGKWGWASQKNKCAPEHSITITFNDTGSKMYHSSQSGLALTTSEETYDRIVYSILAEGDKLLRTIVINETQKTEEGEMFLWDLILKDDKSFCWKQSEWPEGHCTERLVRCEN
ncbi:hypothetical protein A7985_07420 [Pseudoalteromonas luteoviolacea]|uniref:DUF4198 domain-containing protein n=1 Tax=Pseudoalteromonas luteoviolacea TaxID=43657 RepID=A0A1C0TWR9_9GAMM|nr:hypothetical protein [Pseudoalteromonas luteoviolacea]OCQ23761.1 hypothetical protein A7985_07420 [Pseudoalteromonas luteoviolacea]